MKIEIELTPKEITEIVIEYLQPMFPGKYITGKIGGYGVSHLVAIDKKPEETVKKE